MTKVAYDVIQALNQIPRMVDATAEGLWHEVASPREAIIREARGLLDEAARLIEEQLPEELLPYIDESEIAAVAAALAFERLENWNVLDSTLEWVEIEAQADYDGGYLS